MDSSDNPDVVATPHKFLFHPDEISWTFVANQITDIVHDLAEQGLTRNIDYKLNIVHDYSGKYKNSVGTVFYAESPSLRLYISIKYA